MPSHYGHGHDSSETLGPEDSISQIGSRASPPPRRRSTSSRHGQRHSSRGRTYNYTYTYAYEPSDDYSDVSRSTAQPPPRPISPRRPGYCETIVSGASSKAGSRYESQSKAGSRYDTSFRADSDYDAPSRVSGVSRSISSRLDGLHLYSPPRHSSVKSSKPLSDNEPSLKYRLYDFRTKKQVRSYKDNPSHGDRKISGLQQRLPDGALEITTGPVQSFGSYRFLVFVRPDSKHPESGFRRAIVKDLRVWNRCLETKGSEYPPEVGDRGEHGFWRRRDGALMVGVGTVEEVVEGCKIASVGDY